MDVVVNGFLFGLLLAAMIGPVFFALLHNSIHNGFPAGVQLALGVTLSDSSYILICLFGVSQFLDNEQFKMFLAMGGGIIMLVFGAISIFKPVPRKAVTMKNKGNGNVWRYILKGFLINGVNPFVLIYWLGVVSVATVNHGYEKNDLIIFFVAILGTVLGTDILKAYLANKLRSMMTPRFMKIMNWTAGTVLILFSLRLFYFGYGLM
ncbi:LysE family translocator [Fulvivirgaceae bacterium BMA10]|uniref:LysE family translocator n=1 Tax=Splendidivirga corallicola TaxID=3051826 RepID=A0ABT8KW13_9BACT|nr:LysE family translocator [Fulvivirgaceae bacterium BMA10]